MTDIATTASPARSIVFIDSRVQDAATLLQGLAPGTEVVFLQAGQDGLAQMAAALGERGDVGAVQVIAHGSAGQLWLGSRFLDNTTLQQPEVQAALAALGRGLTADGDLLLYACNTAEGSEGAQFVSTLAALTGADVAASDDRTGAGGDWALEISTGCIEQAAMLSAQGAAAYQHGLATLTVTSTADSGAGTLRKAISDAVAGDTITFNAGMTIDLSTKASGDSLLILNKNLTIDGDLNNDGIADVTLDGQYKGRVLEVTTGTTATLDGLVITQGLLAGNGGDAWEGVASSAADALGAGILNSGTLTVVNSTISANVATGGGGGGAGVGGAGGGGSGFNGIGGGAGGKQIYNNKQGAPGGMGIGGGGAADTPPPSGSTGGSGYGTRLGGNGGTSTDGGLGGLGYPLYGAPAGGQGGKVTGAGGGGGGGSFYPGGATYIGGNGGTAAGAVHITSSGILFLAKSTLSGNLGAGGGGGAGGVAGTPGAGGQGIGAIYNLGQLHYNAGTTTFTSNEGGGGTAGNGGATATGTAILAGNAASSTTWTNDLPPTVTVTAVPVNGTYKAGDNLDFTVIYNEAVTVNTAAGTPSIALTLDTGGTVQAAYIGGSTTNALTFRYTVAAGNLDANGITAANSISLNGGTIRDSGNNNAPTTGIPFASTTGVLVDAVAPSVSSINLGGVATTNATSVNYTVTFSETVTGVNAGDFTLISSGASGSIAAVTGSGSAYTVIVNGITGDGTLRLELNPVGTGITDAAGNAITGGFSGQSYTIDNTAPAAPSGPDLAPASDTGVSGADNITNDTTPTFIGTAEAGSTVTLYADGVTALGSAVATGGAWSITTNPLSQGTRTVTAKATDAAGNVGAASAGLSVTIDTAAPTLAITSNVSTLKIGETATITFTFSEDPGASFSWDGSTGDVVVSGGTLSALSGTGLTRTATFTPTANTNGGTASITVASGTYIDTAGNSGGAGVTPALTFDTLAPAAPSAPDLASASDTGVSNTDDITSNTTPTFTGTAEAGSTVTLYADGVSALGTATADGSGNWSFISSTLPSGTHTLSAKATDSAGNVSIASAGLTVTVDANPPSKPAAPVLATASDVGQSNSDGITNLTSLTLQGAAGSVEANATVHARSSLDGGLTNTVANADGSWSLNVTGLAQGTHQLQINATDAAGNTSTYSDASTVVIDTTAPTLAITSNVSALKTGETATITFTFSEDPGSTFTWDGTAGDVVVTGGTLSAISGTGATRTATFTPNANTNGGTASITVTAASYTDMAGNAGGAGTTPSLSFDTLGPSTTASGFAFSADNGASAIDLVTNQAAQTISGTLSAALVAGESVEVSLDNGSTWAMAAATVGSSTWSLAGQTLAGSDTLQARVKDAAGNTGASTSKAYVLDVTAPTFHPTTGSAPADDASAVPVSGSLVLSFSEALASLDSTKVYLKDVNTDTLVAATISLNGSGKLVIQPTAALQNSTAYYVTWDAGALRDAAGNPAAAVADETTYNFTTQAAPPSPPEQPSTPTVPAPVPVPVDGAQVTTQTGADGTITTTIAPVTPGRVDDPNTPNATLADVPLFQSGGNPVLLASLPVGFGLSASTPGLSTAGNSLTDLVRQIQQHTAAGSQDQSQLTSGGASFLGGLPSTTPLLVQTIVPTYQGSGMPGQALGISGQPAVTGQPLTALVINASVLPSGTSLQLNNVEFAAIIGSVSVSGGAGSQHVWGDGASQTIFLGADDDVLHGGGGNDTVGSLGGNDQVFGDAGDDIVFGGTGHDTLSGGTGNDRLDGGLGWDTALQIGSVADYTLRTEGQFLVMTHKTTGEVDRLKSIETVQFDSGANLYIADSNAEAAIAHIVTTWLGRDLTPAEGAWAQQHSGLSDLQVAQVLLNVSYAPELQGHTAEELVAGWLGNPQIVRMDVASEHLQGTAELDQMHIGLNLAELSLERTGSDRWEGTSRIDGNMAEFLGIERLHLKDVSVALDTHGTAGQLAALLSVTLGSSALDNKGLVGEGLAALDAGMSVQAVGNIALSLAQAQQGHPFTAQETVQWLWTQATGSAGSMQQLQPLVDGLERGQLSAGALAEAAARYALEHPSVQLLGVLEQGLLYTPV